MSRSPRMDAAKLAFLGLSILTAALLVALVFWASRNYRVQRLVLAAGARDGESFAMARAMKIVVERHFPRVRIAVVETGGTADNLALLDRGKADFATAQADLEAGAFARLVAVLYEDRFQLLAHCRAGVRRFTDLRGKRIALPQSGGQYRSFLRVAEHFGLAPADFTFVGDDEQSADAAFIHGAADAAFRARSAGSPPILALSRGIDIEFIPIAHAAAMHIAVPAYSPSVIPEGAYSGDPPVPSADLPTLAVERTLLARSSVRDDVAEMLAGVLVERRQELASAIPEGSAGLRPLVAEIHAPTGPASDLRPPLHSGAAAFYDRDKPSFVQRNADTIALLITVAVLIGSWIWELRKWVQRRQKNRADHYNRRVVELMNAAQSIATAEELERARLRLLEIFSEAVEELDHDRISDEAFHSLRAVWQVAVDSVRDRRALLASSGQ